MTSFSGRILVHNDGNAFRIIADNRGDSPGSLTHCLFKDAQTATTHNFVNGQWVSHDDMTYGHWHDVPAHDAYLMELPVGGEYVRGRGSPYGEFERVKIEPGAILRVGFRKRAWGIVELPEAGSAVELAYDALTPNVAAGRGPPLGWSVTPMEDAPASSDAAVQGALAVLDQFTSKHVVKGRVLITSVFSDAPKTHIGWNVEFVNEGVRAHDNQTTGFTGTVVLLNAQGEGAKNAGLGLEAMPCPDNEYSATQFIARGGDYGVSQFGITAEPGGSMRLGIRGHSNKVVTLPQPDAAPLEITLDSFTVESTKSTPEYFEADTLKAKMGEKKAHVTFRMGNQVLNDSIPDTIYTGDEALTRAEFKDPPSVTISATDACFKVKLESQLPGEDDLGEIAFVARLTVKDANGETVAHRILFDNQSREATIDLPKSSVDVQNGIEAGASLEIDTGPLGWRGTITLPDHGTVGTHVSPQAMLEHWVLRESDYKRAGLLPAAAQGRLRRE